MVLPIPIDTKPGTGRFALRGVSGTLWSGLTPDWSTRVIYTLRVATEREGALALYAVAAITPVSARPERPLHPK